MPRETVAIRWKGDTDFEASLPSGKTVTMSGTGPKPLEMVVASLGGCAALTLQAFLQKMRIEVDHFDLDVEGVLAEERPSAIVGARVRIRFYGRDLKQEQIERAMELAKKYCPVHHTLIKAGPIEYSYEIHPTNAN